MGLGPRNQEACSVAGKGGRDEEDDELEAEGPGEAVKSQVFPRDIGRSSRFPHSCQEPT